MSNNFSQNHAPELVGNVVHVAGGLIGSSLIDGLRKSFTSNNQVQQGDYFMDQSRILLLSHLQLMELHEQSKIQRKLQKSREVKQGLVSHDGSKFQKFLKARKYKRISKQTYTIVKDASDRAIDNQLMNQIAEATRPRGSGSGSDESGSGPMTSSVISNPFSDSHAISNLSQVTVNELDRVEMSTYQEEDTTEAAVVLDLVGQDESVQHVVATFSTEAFSGDRTDSGASQSMASEAPSALSLHREDGSSPRFIAAPLPEVSNLEDRVDGQAETSTLDSFSQSKAAKWTLKGKCPPPPTRASVHPIDSDTYTRSIGPRIRRK